MAIEEHDVLTIDSEGTTFPASGGSTLARFDRPQGSGTTLAVVADPHLTPTERGSLKLYHRTKQRLQMALADAHRLDVDGLVVAGDLTKDGTVGEYALADDLLATAPTPAIAVPGNHDVGPSGPVGSGTAFARRYGCEQYPCSVSLDGVSVLALDSTQSDSEATGGTVDGQSLERLANRTPRSEPQIALFHHPLGPVPDPLDGVLPEREFRLRTPERVADALVEAGVDVVVTGHLHWPYATRYRGLTVVGAPGCSSFPPAYLLVHLDSRGTTVTIVPLAGEAGLREAYRYAVDHHRRGETIREAVEAGYFGQFPLVDDQDQYGRESVPTPFV